MKFTGRDRLRFVAYTIVLGAAVIALAGAAHASLHIEAILLGFSAAIASLTVHVEVLRRELRRLSGGTPAH